MSFSFLSESLRLVWFLIYGWLTALSGFFLPKVYQHWLTRIYMQVEQAMQSPALQVMWSVLFAQAKLAWSTPITAPCNENPNVYVNLFTHKGFCKLSCVPWNETLHRLFQSRAFYMRFVVMCNCSTRLQHRAKFTFSQLSTPKHWQTQTSDLQYSKKTKLPTHCLLRLCYI